MLPGTFAITVHPDGSVIVPPLTLVAIRNDTSLVVTPAGKLIVVVVELLFGPVEVARLEIANGYVSC